MDASHWFLWGSIALNLIALAFSAWRVWLVGKSNRVLRQFNLELRLALFRAYNASGKSEPPPPGTHVEMRLTPESEETMAAMCDRLGIDRDTALRMIAAGIERQHGVFIDYPKSGEGS